MARQLTTLLLLGLHVCAWYADPASGGDQEQAGASVEQLEELERELVEAREQGNDAEVAEIRTLMEELRDAAMDADSPGRNRVDYDEEDDELLRARLKELERELETARNSGNVMEVEEIQELMVRLKARMLDEETSTVPRADTVRVEVDNISNVKFSSATCGFTLIYCETAGSQLAVMEPAGILVGSVEAGGMISVLVPIVNVDGPFRIRASAEVWGDRSAEISLSLNEPGTLWYRLTNTSTPLEVNGLPEDDSATLSIRMRSNKSQATVRLANLELVSGEQTCPMTLPVSALSIEKFHRPELPAMHPGIERALIEWDWRMQDGIGTARERRTYDQTIEETLKRGDTLIEHLTQTGTTPNEAILRWNRLREE